PKLWARRLPQEIRLGELSRKACERLLREVLGDGVAVDVVDRIIERSQGHAFFLEELARAEAEGWGEQAPGTVLAMVQSRLEAMTPETRRVLRAGSIFGETFWRGAVAALLEENPRSAALDGWLTDLEACEWIAPRREARFQREQEYAFRHALVREVAYGMLTREDRTLGHRLAGEWLERIGETEAKVIAWHLDLGGEPSRAIGWYRRAAEQELEGSDLGAALEQVERAF